MRLPICLQLATMICFPPCMLPAAASGEELLPQFARVLGFPDSAQITIPDGRALTFWSIGVTEDSARVLFRVEMEDEACRVRVTSVVQDPPKWGQLQVTIYDFSKLTDVKAFTTFDDMASQKNPIDLADAKSYAASFSGERFRCTSMYDLGGTPPEAYPYCEGRHDIVLPKSASARAATLEAVAGVSTACNVGLVRQ